MTEPILLQFIKKVYKTNLDYCVICLRTSQERRLEKPVYLKKVIQNVSNLDQNKQCFVFNHVQQLVCFVCERQAAGAARFLAALGLASHTHAALQRLLHSPALRNQFYNDFHQYTMSKSKQDLSKGAPESLLLLETKLLQQRVNSQLLLTEVLIVSTPNTVDCPPDPLSSDCEVTSGPGDSRDMYVLPDLLPAPDREERTSDALDVKTESDIKMESILICDDDNPFEAQPSLSTNTATPRLLSGTSMTAPIPTSIGPRIGMTAPIPTSIGPRIGMTAPIPTSIGPRIGMTAPIPTSIGPRKGTITPIIQPTKTSNKTTESRLESDARVVPIEPVLESTASPLILSTPSFILHPLVFNSGMMTVPSLAANIMEGQMVTSVENTLTFETPELAFQNENSIDFITEPEKVTSILKKLSHHEASKVFIFRPMSRVAVSADTNTMIDPNPPNLDQNAKNIGTVNSSDPNKRTDGVKTAPICAVGEARILESREKDGINASDSGGRTRSDERKGRNGDKGSEAPLLRSYRMDWEGKIPMDAPICAVGEARTLESGERDVINASDSGGRTRSDQRKGSNGDKESETPRLRSYRIDWEDKIPMDVISFVDEAETTCKRSRRSEGQPPPLGISNVTSLSKVDAASQADDIIDLC